MVKMAKKNKNLEENPLKKKGNGIKKEAKQKLLLKTKKNTDGELKQKVIKKVKNSKNLATHVENVVQPKIKKTEEKKILKGIKRKNSVEEMKVVSEASKIKAKNIKKITKKNSENKSKTHSEALETNSASKETNFDEKQFESIVTLDNILELSKALKKLAEDQVTEKKTSIFSDYRYILNVASYKIPNCPKRIVKLKLKHSLVDINEDDVVLFVPDLQRGAKVDYEPTIQHYEDLLQECGVNRLKIIPLNQLRKEYTGFEAKRKLANTYDYFLCDGRIVGHVVGFCGKNFQKPRTTIHSVRFNDTQKLKSNIEKALRRTSFKQLNKGDVISIPVGSNRFTLKQLAENIKFVIDQLKAVFPGGYANVRNMYLKIDIKGTSALPLYVNLAGSPLETPNVIGPREKRMLKLKKQANDVLSKFSLSKTGDFVKLSKSQVERKRDIRDARAVLLSKASDANDTIIPPTKKIKKSKDSAEQNEEVSEDEDEEDLVDMDSEENEEEDDSENSDEEE